MKFITNFLLLATTCSSTFSQFNLRIDGVEVPASHEFECFVSPRNLTISHDSYDSLSFQGAKIKYYEYAKSAFIEKSFTKSDVNINSTGVIKPAFAIKKEPLIITLGTVKGYKDGLMSNVKVNSKTIKIHFKSISLHSNAEYERVNKSSKIALMVNQELVDTPVLSLIPGDRMHLKLPENHKMISGKIQFLTAPKDGGARPMGGQQLFHSEAELNYIFRNWAERASLRGKYAVMINILCRNKDGIIPLNESLFFKVKSSGVLTGR